jgi:hypothetical protein
MSWKRTNQEIKKPPKIYDGLIFSELIPYAITVGPASIFERELYSLRSMLIYCGSS